MHCDERTGQITMKSPVYKADHGPEANAEARISEVQQPDYHTVTGVMEAKVNFYLSSNAKITVKIPIGKIETSLNTGPNGATLRKRFEIKCRCVDY